MTNQDVSAKFLKAIANIRNTSLNFENPLGIGFNTGRHIGYFEDYFNVANSLP